MRKTLIIKASAGRVSSSITKWVAQYFPHFTCSILRFYFRYFPSDKAKLKVWEKLVRPYLIPQKRSIVARLKNGSRIYGNFPDVIHVYLYFFGVWEPAITAYYERVLRPGDIVIDIGANVGVHALLAADLVGATGRVYAVEASPTIFRQLTRNLDLNHVSNLFAYNYAVLDRAEPVPVFLHHDENIGGTTIVMGEALHRNSTLEGFVEGRPLSAIIPSDTISAARLIKIDVEGAEWLVIKGLQDTFHLLHQDVSILVEVTVSSLENFGVTVQEFLSIFKQYDFIPFRLRNEYTPEFYIRPGDVELIPFEEDQFDIADIVFRRAHCAVRC